MRIKLKGDVLIAASMYLLIFYLCLPYSMVILNSLLIYMIAFISAAFFIIGMMLMNKWKQLVSFLIILGFTFFYWRITWSVQLNSVTYVYYSYASLVFVFGGIALYSSENESLLKRLFLFLTVIYFVTAITSIMGLRVYPLASRELARGSTYDTSLDFTKYKNIYRRMNIASWSQVYGMLFAIPAALMIWKKKRKLSFVILAVVLTLTLVASQITFAVLLAIVLIAATFIPREKNKKTVLIILVFLFIAPLILLGLEPILTFAIDWSETAGLDFLTTKLNDLKILLFYRSAVGDAGERIELYQKSFDTFLRNPIGGLILDGKASLDKIGYHSEFFDLLGTFGFIGLMVMLISFGRYFGFIRGINKESRRDLIFIFIGFIGLFIFNPVFNSPQIFAGAFLYSLLVSRYCLMDDFKQKQKTTIRLKLH